MKNKIRKINRKKLEKIKNKISSDDLFLELDGNDLQTIDDYLDFMGTKLNFPVKGKSIDGYLDWMTDLQWLKKKRYILVIENFNQFLLRDPAKKKIIMDTFEEVVLPWWEKDIKKHMVGGKPQPFNLYIVE
ncbi:MAG: barstar family protein [Streptococcaceae bacterium]|jgi:hypothetical protein|nr:barstar family protein [Streptococcaceae bacterium]